jgi:hypothetical protein
LREPAAGKLEAEWWEPTLIDVRMAPILDVISDASSAIRVGAEGLAMLTLLFVAAMCPEYSVALL